VSSEQLLSPAGQHQSEVDNIWHNTWSAWRSGALDELGDARRESAGVSLGAFVESFDLNGDNQPLRQFMNRTNFTLDEFLIAYEEQDRDAPSFVLTNHRLWLFNTDTKNLQSFGVPDIVEFTSKGFWTVKADLRLKDGSQHHFEKLAAVPSDEMLDVTRKGFDSEVIAAAQSGMPDPEPATAPMNQPITEEEPAVMTSGETDTADQEEEEARVVFELDVGDGDTNRTFDARALREAILGGEAKKGRKCRSVTVDAGGNRIEADWTTVEEVAVGSAELRDLYRPVWHKTLVFALYGALTGVVLKMLDTTVTLFAIDDQVGVLWLVVIGSLLVTRWVWFAPLVAIGLMVFSGVQANLFITAIAAALVGATVGTPAGMIVGTIVGLARASGAQKAPDAGPEGRRPLLLGIVLPLIALAILIPLLIAFTKWAAGQM